jgi:hypothetical protein
MLEYLSERTMEQCGWIPDDNSDWTSFARYIEGPDKLRDPLSLYGGLPGLFEKVKLNERFIQWMTSSPPQCVLRQGDRAIVAIFHAIGWQVMRRVGMDPMPRHHRELICNRLMENCFRTPRSKFYRELICNRLMENFQGGVRNPRSEFYRYQRSKWRWLYPSEKGNKTYADYIR